jgi:Zn-dependent protease
MGIVEIIIIVVILLFSVIFHEVAHGLMAYRLGDPTAKFAGRLTLNPIPHIDLFGSILLPAMLFYLRFSTGLNVPILGSAKPVPVNYTNLKDIRSGMILVSIVGPLTNIALAIVAAAVLKLSPGISAFGELLLLETITMNIGLAVFNMLPLPPLDGSKVLAGLLGYINQNLMYRLLDLERFGFMILIGVLILVPQFLSAVLLPPIYYILEMLL